MWLAGPLQLVPLEGAILHDEVVPALAYWPFRLDIIGANAAFGVQPPQDRVGRNDGTLVPPGRL